MVKRGCSEENSSLNLLSLGNAISAEKKNNVKTLLEKQFSNEDLQWQDIPELKFYQEILIDNTSQIIEEDDHEESCDCTEEDHVIHIQFFFVFLFFICFKFCLNISFHLKQKMLPSICIFYFNKK